MSSPPSTRCCPLCWHQMLSCVSALVSATEASFQMLAVGYANLTGCLGISFNPQVCIKTLLSISKEVKQGILIHLEIIFHLSLLILFSSLDKE